jgi:hypothetical protein
VTILGAAAPTDAPARLGFFGAIALVFGTAVRHRKTCIAISSVYAVLSGVTNAVGRSSTGVVDPSKLDASDVAAAGVEALIAIAVLVLVNVFAAPVTLGALSLVGSAAVYGDEVETEGIVRRALDRALDAVAAAVLTLLLLGVPLIGVGLVALLFVFVSGPLVGFAVLLFGSLFLAIPLLYAIVKLSLAVPVVMREGQGPFEALRRSWTLVSGAWWWVFGVGVVMALILGTLNGFLSFRSFFGEDTAIDFIIGAVVTAVAAAITVTLYGIASGVVYATRAPEDVHPPGVVESEARAGDELVEGPMAVDSDDVMTSPPPDPVPPPEQ